MRHFVVRAAQLEAVYFLLVFALEQHGVAQALAQVFGDLQRGYNRHVVHACVEGFLQIVLGCQVLTHALMINVAKYGSANQGLNIKGAKKSPELCSLGLNPSFQRMEETIRASNKIENYLLLA